MDHSGCGRIRCMLVDCVTSLVAGVVVVVVLVVVVVAVAVAVDGHQCLAILQELA